MGRLADNTPVPPTRWGSAESPRQTKRAWYSGCALAFQANESGSIPDVRSKKGEIVNTTQVGDISEQKFILRCLELDIPVLKPVGNNLPYDAVIELDGSFKKVQVKTGYAGRAPSTVQFNTRSTSKNYTEVVSRGYDNDVDYFAVVYTPLQKIMLIPIKDIAKGTMVLFFGDKPTYRQKSCSDYYF